jgi:hypothetical protein
MVNCFDCDGVITIGIRPAKDDIIITGRSFEERPETEKFMKEKGITNKIFFNPLKFDQKTRQSSGEWKARVLTMLKNDGRIDVKIMFEDDPIQLEVVKEKCPWIKIVHIVHDLTEKENVGHDEQLRKIGDLRDG